MKLSKIDQIKIIVSGTVVALLLSVLGGYELIQSYVIQHDFSLGYLAFHSLYQLQFSSSKATYDQIDKTSEAMISYLDALYDRYEPRIDDEGNLIQNLYQINASYGSGQWLTIDASLFEMLQLSYEYTMNTSGAYNLFIGALVDVWKLYMEIGSGKPSDEIIEQALNCVPTTSQITQDSLLEFNPEDSKIRFNSLPNCDNSIGVKISLGGMAKGYAVQKVGDELKDYQIPIFFSGGRSSVRLVSYDGLIFEGGLTNPLYEDDPSLGSEQSSLLTLILEGDVGISSSGDYEQFTMVDGQRYHHILNPNTGYSENYFRNVTIISQNSALADALTTALMVLSLEEGQNIVKHYRLLGAELDVIWVAQNEDNSLSIYTDGHSFSSTKDSIFPVTDLTLIE